MYGRDLSFIHAAGFEDFARAAAPRIVGRLRGAGIRKGLVVELGCGSGAATRALILAGYDALAMDVSIEMLKLARRKAPRARFSLAHLPDVVLPPCDAVVAVGEVLNYMARRADFDSLFRRVFEALRPGGLFLFDARLPGGKAGTFGKYGSDWAVLAASREKNGLLTREIVSFRREGKNYRRSTEVHRQILPSADELKKRLRAAGFTASSAPMSERHVLIEARRK